MPWLLRTRPTAFREKLPSCSGAVTAFSARAPYQSFTDVADFARGFQRTIDIPSGGDGAGRSIFVPIDYIEEKAAPIFAANGGDYEAMVLATALNRLNKVWECHAARLAPTNAADVFRAGISIGADGEPIIGWEPDLNEGGTKQERVYTVEGRESLTEGSWGPTNAASRFFKVKVEMR